MNYYSLHLLFYITCTLTLKFLSICGKFYQMSSYFHTAFIVVKNKTRKQIITTGKPDEQNKITRFSSFNILQTVHPVILGITALKFVHHHTMVFHVFTPATVRNVIISMAVSLLQGNKMVHVYIDKYQNLLLSNNFLKNYISIFNIYVKLKLFSYNIFISTIQQQRIPQATKT